MHDFSGGTCKRKTLSYFHKFFKHAFQRPFLDLVYFNVICFPSCSIFRYVCTYVQADYNIVAVVGAEISIFYTLSPSRILMLSKIQIGIFLWANLVPYGRKITSNLKNTLPAFMHLPTICPYEVTVSYFFTVHIYCSHVVLRGIQLKSICFIISILFASYKQ